MYLVFPSNFHVCTITCFIMCMYVSVHRHVLTGSVSITVHVSFEQPIRPHSVFVLGTALQAAARRSGHSRQPGGCMERRGGGKMSFTSIIIYILSLTYTIT